MKKLFVFLSFFSVLMIGRAQQATVQSPPIESLEITERSFDFGKIPQGRPVTHAFTVVNKGKTPVSIENVQTSCGCTTPQWSKEPIAPGASAVVTVGYNAASEGPFSKTVTVFYSGNQQKGIVIAGNVYRAPATSAPLNASISLLKHINQ